MSILGREQVARQTPFKGGPNFCSRAPLGSPGSVRDAPPQRVAECLGLGPHAENKARAAPGGGGGGSGGGDFPTSGRRRRSQRERAREGRGGEEESDPAEHAPYRGLAGAETHGACAAARRLAPPSRGRPSRGGGNLKARARMRERERASERRPAGQGRPSPAQRGRL